MQQVFQDPLHALKTGMRDANKKVQREYFNNPKRSRKFAKHIPELLIEVIRKKSRFARNRPDYYIYKLIVGPTCIGSGCPKQGHAGGRPIRMIGLPVVMRAHMHNISARASDGDKEAFGQAANAAFSYTDKYEEWIGVYTRSGPPVMRHFKTSRKQKTP